MENEENPKTKVAQLVTSFSAFSICHKTFAYLLMCSMFLCGSIYFQVVTKENFQ